MSLLNVVRKFLSSTDVIRSLKDFSEADYKDTNDEVIRESYKYATILANPFTESEECRIEAVRCLALNAYFGGPVLNNLAGKQIPHIVDFLGEYETSGRAKVEIVKALSTLCLHKENRRMIENRDYVTFLASNLVNPPVKILARWTCYLLTILCSDITLIREIYAIPNIAHAIYPLAVESVPWNGWRINYAMRLFNLLGFDKKEIEEKILVQQAMMVDEQKDLVSSIDDSHAHDLLSKGLTRLTMAGSTLASYSRNALRRLSNRPTKNVPSTTIGLPDEPRRSSEPVEMALRVVAASSSKFRRNTTGTSQSSDISEAPVSSSPDLV